MAAVTDLIRVILPAWERSLPFHPCKSNECPASRGAAGPLLSLTQSAHPATDSHKKRSLNFDESFNPPV